MENKIFPVYILQTTYYIIMNLIWFLTIGAIFSTILGEFGKYPFGSTGTSIGILDILVSILFFFFIVWQIGIQKKLLFSKPFIILVIFWIWGFITLVFSGNFLGGLYLIRFIIYSSLFYLSFILVNTKQIKIENVFKKITFAGVALAIIGFLQILFFPDLSSLEYLGFDPHKNRLFSTFLDPNFTGTFLNISLTAATYIFIKDKSKFYLGAILILILAIFLTFSRSAYLMFLIQFLVFNFLNYKKAILGGLFVMVLLFIFIPQFNQRISGAFLVDKSASERFGSWQSGFSIFQNNKLVGVGFNNLKSVKVEENLLKPYQSQDTHSLGGIDSSLLFILATTGIIGLLIYLDFWINLVKIYIKLSNKNLKILMLTLILALFINSQFINSLFYPEIMVLYFTLFGASAGSIE